MRGTGNRPAQTLRFFIKDDAPVLAQILKQMDRSSHIAHHDHRDIQKCDWLAHARLSDVLAKTYSGQIVAKKSFLLLL